MPQYQLFGEGKKKGYRLFPPPRVLDIMEAILYRSLYMLYAVEVPGGI